MARKDKVQPNIGKYTYTLYEEFVRLVQRVSGLTTTNIPEGSNLYFTDERAQDAVGSILLNTATIDLTYDDSGADIFADLKDTTVVAGTYGSATQIPVYTVDAQGRLIASTHVTATNAFANSLLNIVDQKAQNTNGGTFTSGTWRTRDLNTVRTNEIAGASLAANQITLPAGTYFCEWSAPMHENNNTVNPHTSRIQNITDATTLLNGATCTAASDGTTHSLGVGRFTLAASKTLELQHQLTNTQTTTGFGRAANFSVEIYSQISIWKVA